MRLYDIQETKDTLPVDVYNLLLHKNSCDMQIYEAMLKRFNEQLEYLSDKANYLNYYFVPQY